MAVDLILHYFDPLKNGKMNGKSVLPNVIDMWKIPPLLPVDSADYCMDIMLAVIEAFKPPSPLLILKLHNRNKQQQK